MSDRTLEEWLQHALALHPRGIDMGLERVSRVATRLGLRRPAPLCFVVGGTNGKGSTTIAIEQVLRAAGLRTGATISPHFFRFNERVRIDGREADDALLCAAFAAIEAARGETTLSYFELGMLVALWCFAHERVDAAVIEVGLGGRLDAANVVDADVAVVTTVALDHMDYLGPDRASIGWDKAHIARAGRPLVIGDPDPPERMLEVAREIGAHVLRRGHAFDSAATQAGVRYRGPGGERVYRVHPLLFVDNIGNALAALEAAGHLPAPEIVERALASARNPGRLQRVRNDPRVLVDVAHNPHAAQWLAARLGEPCATNDAARGRTHVVLGALADKDYAGVVEALAGVSDVWWLAGTRGERGLPAKALAEVVRATGSTAEVHCFDAAKDALDAARATAHGADRIVVCGCFQVAGDALAALGEDACA